MNAQNTPSKGLFIGLRRDQLGARLLMMLNAIRLSIDFDTDYRVNWFPRGAMAPTLARPIELFTQDYIDQHFIEGEDYEAAEEGAKPFWSFLEDDTPDKLRAHLAAGKNVILDEGFEVVAFAWEDPEALRKRYRSFIKEIGFQPFIQAKMDRIDAALGHQDGTVAAYHIRRGDLLNEDPWKDNLWPSKIEPDELYFAHIGANPDTLPLVFSDQEENIQRIRSRYPQVRGIKDLIDLDDCKVCQRDFLELYTMSRADSIIAPMISAFSMAAARLSGQQRLRFVDLLSVDEFNAAYDAVWQRFEDGLDSFVSISEAAHIYSRLSRVLSMNDRDEDAYVLGRRLLDAGADNAFLPMLHALTCCYLGKWKEANHSADLAIASPGIWNEHYATCLAIKSYAEGALGYAVLSRAHWLQAFWLKPHLLDVIVPGSYLIYHRRLRPGRDIPFDDRLLRELRMPYSNIRILAVHQKLLRRRALDLRLLILEWPYFVLDRKSLRLLEDKVALTELYERIQQETENPEMIPNVDSCGALIQSYLGQHDLALEMNNRALAAEPDNMLFQKRQSEILWAAGKEGQALKQQRAICDIYPNNPYYAYLHGHYLAEAGRHGQARPYFEIAAAKDGSTARIHARMADICQKDKDLPLAVSHLQKAAELAPSYKQFTNKLKRFSAKL